MSLFVRADLVGEFRTRADAERALGEAVAADHPGADELAVIEFGENGERVSESMRGAP